MVVCEPQFRGSIHATFNAALLAAAARAFPGEPITFAAHPSHAEWVRSVMPVGDPGAEAVLVALPALRRDGRVRRTIGELRVWFGVLVLARRRRRGDGRRAS